MFVTKYVDCNVNKMILQPGLLNTGYVTFKQSHKQKEKNLLKRKESVGYR